MKNKFIKILSALLVLSFLATTLSVFSFAEDTGNTGVGEEDSLNGYELFTNRDFSEGWDSSNGFTAFSAGANKINIDYEEDILGNYNYFSRFEVAGGGASYARVEFGALAVTHATREDIPGTVVEFSIKADDLAKLGTIMSMKTTVKGNNIKLLDITAAGELVAFNGMDGGSYSMGILGNEWVNIAFIFDWLSDDLKCTVKMGYGHGNGYNDTLDRVLTMPYLAAGDLGMHVLELAIPTLAARGVTTLDESMGMSYCIDDLKVYHGPRSIVEVKPDTFGKFLDLNAPKVVDIKEGSHIKSKDQLLEEALAMKVGVDRALVKNEKYPLINNSESELYNGKYGAPVKQGDEILIPMQLILDYIGFPSYTHPDNMSLDITTGQSTTYIRIGSSKATVDGKEIDLSVAPGFIENSVGEKYLVISLSDVPVLFPGWLTVYDEMGLIILYQDMTPDNLNDNAPIINRNENLETMLNIMKKFVFEVTASDGKAESYIANGEKVYSDVKTNTEDFAHPYIIADADTFKTLADKYKLTEGSEGYDKALKSYIQIIVDKANKIYSDYAEVSGTGYVGIKGTAPAQPADTSDGYDQNGEMAEALRFANMLPDLAFAYQMTGNSDYAKLAYDISAALAGFEHWGPGYASHMAQITSAYAIAYDWFYNEYKNLGLDTDVLAKAIYNLGVHDGYVSSAGKACEHGRVVSDLSVYNTSRDSVNAIGTSGMVIGALAILDYVDGEGAPTDSYSETMYLLGNNMETLGKYGLDIYAKDGSYIESPEAWETATSSFYRMSMALMTAAGNDYGFMGSWSMDKTCYYAIHIENSDGEIWNYHDSMDGVSLNTDMFYFVGGYYGDEILLAVRQDQLEKGRPVTIYDLLYYPMNGITKTPELPLDYYMEAIDGFVSRSDWNSGAIYTGIMAGANDVTNGQLDSGNFIYQNKGIKWIVDLGAENPYISGIDDPSSRYKYYRNSAEGQNVVFLNADATNIYGQRTDVGGYITKTITNEHGSAVIINNTDVYRTYKSKGDISFVQRGLFFTNDRSTVVLQDEFTFVTLGSVAWVAHTTVGHIELDDTKKVAYMTETNEAGETYTLRATIVSRRPDYVFKVQSATENILSSIESNKAEYSRNNVTKLVIEANEVVSFEAAVVFEIVADKNDKKPVKYSYKYMSEWVPSEYVSEEVGEVTGMRAAPDKADLAPNADEIGNYMRRKTAYTEKLTEFYKALTNIAYVLNEYPVETLTEKDHLNAYRDYVDYAEEYEEFMEFINESGQSLSDFAESLSGLKASEEETGE